jgi:hypothetical protein
MSNFTGNRIKCKKLVTVGIPSERITLYFFQKVINPYIPLKQRKCSDKEFEKLFQSRLSIVFSE